MHSPTPSPSPTLDKRTAAATPIGVVPAVVSELSPAVQGQGPSRGGRPDTAGAVSVAVRNLPLRME